MYDNNGSSMLDYGNASNPMVVGGDPSLQLSGMRKKNKFQSFLGGMQGGQGQPGGIAGGLSQFAGQGGAMGAIGNVAKFFL